MDAGLTDLSMEARNDVAPELDNGVQVPPQETEETGMARGEDVGTPGLTSDREKAGFRNDSGTVRGGVGVPLATCTHRSHVHHICEAHGLEYCLTQGFPIFSISRHIN